jgi:RNA recognition motif-containing protein
VAYTDVLIRTDHHDLARKTFQDMSTKNLDYPEALWDAWHNFEHAHGSLSSLEEAINKITQARAQLETRRAREAEKAYAAAAAQYAEQQVASVPAVSVPAIGVTQGSALVVSESMDVDVSALADTKGKRKAEEEPPVTETSGGKKPRLETPPVPLKRDRENCTVFVADLPSEATEADLKALFKDCGDIRDIKFTRMPETLVATVEFYDRDSVPAALTKDKKRIHETEIGVHLAWRSTLYVTNFPEKFDDTSIRDLFGQYGLIFDVRWPSKKFKATRRFCYLQYTSPSSAERALELHGRELEPDRAISVLISNPERKKERSDADANERELYVAGLSKFTTKEDLRKVFETYGPIKEIRLAEDKSGQPKGFAFIDFESETDARAALAANNHELKNRRIAVTFTDSRVRAKNKEGTAETGLGRRADARNRSVRVRNIPSGTQEGLLHQLLEKHSLVKRTEIFAALNEAVVELENPAEAGKLLLRTEPIILGGNVLQFSEEQAGRGQPAAPPPETRGMFVPRAAGSRPRAGLGRARKPGATQASLSSNAQPPEQKEKKGQDDFRKMLG